MKKLLAICLCVLMVVSCSVFAFASDEGNAALQFNDNGEFKIMLLADCQDGYPTKEAMIAYINEALDAENPDLVVFLGDNIVSSDLRSYDELLAPLVERDVPFTLVFGNHDDESSNLNKEQQLAKYQSYTGCLAYDADPSLHGCATHNLPILSSDGTKVAFNLWMLDSGDYVFDESGEQLGYDCVRADQLDWYKAQSTALEEANGGLVPSMAFQHIIAEEVVQKVFLPAAFGLGELTFNFTDGTHTSYMPNLANIDGILLEKSCPSFDNDGQWDAMLERGDVLAVFTGHDHVNSFKADVDGIEAIQVPGITYNSYSKTCVKGAEIVTVNENDPENYSSEVLYAFDLALKDGSSIPGLSDTTKADYAFAKVVNTFLKALMKVLNITFIAGKLF